MRSIYCRAPGHSFFPSSNFNECMYKDANVHPRVSLHTASAPNGQQSRISHASSLNSDHCARNREKRAAASQEELGGERTFAHGWQAPSRRGPKRARPCLVMPAHGAVVCVRSVFLRPPSGLRRFESDVAQTGVVVHACSRSRRNMRLCARASQTLCMQAGVGGWTDRMRCSKARSEPNHTLAFGAHTCALSTKRISQADQVQPTYDYLVTHRRQARAHIPTVSATRMLQRHNERKKAWIVLSTSFEKYVFIFLLFRVTLMSPPISQV